MKPTIKITRTNFPNQTMLYWMTYFTNILEKKYEVVIDNENPDLVFWTNVYSSSEQIDSYTNEFAKSHTDFPNAKKIYCSCEITASHLSIVETGYDHYAIGPEPLVHGRYLHLPIHNTTAAWGLYDESKLFDTPYDWLTEPRDGQKILDEKKHFCGVVQNSVIPLRVEYFNKLSNYKFVRASGQWITNVPPEEATITHPRIDGEGYLSKINFLNDCKFSLQIQSNVLPYLTVEKMIQAYAANTLPIYYGNELILEDGFNPKAFINCHDFNSVDDVVNEIMKIDSDDDLYIKMMSEPIFVGNKLPEYFNHDYVLGFLDKIINNQ
jgi:hypothetical protein